MQPLNIRTNRIISIGALVVGVLLLLASAASGAWVSVAAGAVLALLGVLTFVNPMLRIQQDEVQVCNPIGMVLKRFPVESAQDLVVDGRTLRHAPTQKRITSLGFGAHPDDVATLKARLGAAG